MCRSWEGLAVGIEAAQVLLDAAEAIVDAADKPYEVTVEAGLLLQQALDEGHTLLVVEHDRLKAREPIVIEARHHNTFDAMNTSRPTTMPPYTGSSRLNIWRVWACAVFSTSVLRFAMAVSMRARATSSSACVTYSECIGNSLSGAMVPAIVTWRGALLMCGRTIATTCQQSANADEQTVKHASNHS